MTLLLEIHGWRGIGAAGGSLIYVLTLGWVTVGFAPFQITRKLAELTAALKGLVRR